MDMKRITTVLTGCLLLIGSGGYAQDLQSYIREAYANNPELQSYQLRYERSEVQAEASQWIPNTEFSAGYFVSEPETRTGAQKARFSARQMLPWFGTLSAREDYARSLAEAEYIDLLIARRKLALDVAQSYYELCRLSAREAVLQDNGELLETYEELALTAVEVGNASAVDVLKLQIRQNELREQLEVLRETFGAQQAEFNALLGRSPEMEVVVNPVPIPERDPILDDSIQLNPELLRFEKLYASVARAELLNQKESAPSLGIGLDYIPVQERPVAGIEDNGKDIFMPMVTLSIPIFNNRFDSRSRQNRLRQEEIKAMKQQRRHVLEAALARAIRERAAARIRYTSRQQSQQQAGDAEAILIKNYETGSIDFNDLLDIQELQLRLQLSQIDAIKAYYEQSAVIQYISN